MAEVSLYNSTICRLCAEDNDNGEMLFTDDAKETVLSAMVNRYLPLKIHDDGKFPRTICPGCNIQLEATVQFFQLLIDGQRKIREMWKQQLELRRKTESFNQTNINMPLKNSELINDSLTDSDKQQIIYNVMPNGSIYSEGHDLSLQMEGLNQPKKKRGRPSKSSTLEELQELEKDTNIENISQEEEDKHDEEIDGDKRLRRKRKVPKRYMETVQGKELDKILKEEGVFDDENQIKYENIPNINISNVDSGNSNDTEIIGHLETVEGKNLGELVVINKNRACTSKAQKSKLKRKNKLMCSICDKSFKQRNQYILHKNLHKTLKFVKYECTECQEQFANKESLISHQQTTIHTGEKVIEIDEVQSNCKEDEVDTLSTQETPDDISTLNFINDDTSPSTAAGNDELKEVAVNNQNNTVTQDLTQEYNNMDDSFKCNKCNKHFQSKVNLETHIKVGHQGEKPFVCELCDKSFGYHSSLLGHKEIVHQNKNNKNFPCDLCGKVLNHQSSMMYHKLTEHNDGRRFICNKCGKSFKHKQLLQRHQIVHTEDRPYPCKLCNASFKTKANLLNHQSTHTGERKHFCELCDQKFAHKTSLTLHYRTHTGQKPYKCEVCSKSFSQNGNLQEHMRIHTGEKPYCCDHCGRKFTTSSQFKLHVKRHTGERPWKCEFCSKSFLHKDTWKCHVRRHTGERPFQCEHCYRSFTEQWALKKHLRLHTGEKPYNCEICGKAFADCSNLTKHKKVHKNQQIRESKEPVNEPPVEEVWQILPNSRDENENAQNKINRVVTADENAENDMSQIIYVAYQDPENSNESTTLQIGKDNFITDQESNLNAVENNEDSTNIDFTIEPDLQLQIIDEDGNAIPISVQEARQLLSDGRFINQLNSGQIRVQSISDPLETDNKVEKEPEIVKENPESKISTISSLQTDAEAIVRILEDEDTDATAVAAMNQMSIEGQLEQNDSQQEIEFVTQDGQKVRLVTSLNIDPLQLASGYLTIV